MADFDIHHCTDKLSYLIQNKSYSKVFSTDHPRTFRVNLTFFCNYIIHDVLIDNSPSWSQYNNPVTVHSVHLNLQHVSDVPKARKAIRETLSSWILSHHELDELVTYTVQETVKLTSSYAQLGCNVLNLDLQVTLEETQLIVPIRDDDVAMDLIMQLLFEESVPSMVPATVESIKSLKRKRTIDGSIPPLKHKKTIDGISCENCVICLVEVSEDCDAVCMPCSHEFHGYCIEEWLRISHYCPICRFEMPTN